MDEELFPRDKRPDEPAEGVRIIGAEEAEKAGRKVRTVAMGQYSAGDKEKAAGAPFIAYAFTPAGEFLACRGARA